MDLINVGPHKYRLPKCPFTKISFYLNDRLPKYPLSEMSVYQNIHLAKYPLTEISAYRNVRLPKCPPFVAVMATTVSRGRRPDLSSLAFYICTVSVCCTIANATQNMSLLNSLVVSFPLCKVCQSHLGFRFVWLMSESASLVDVKKAMMVDAVQLV